MMNAIILDFSSIRKLTHAFAETPPQNGVKPRMSGSERCIEDKTPAPSQSAAEAIGRD
jgi:hypothetical protein